MRKLEILDLSENKFTGGIPASLGSLSSLEALYLGHNLLNGSLAIQGTKV